MTTHLNSIHFFLSFFFFFLIIGPPPSSTLFPSPTLFRSLPPADGPGAADHDAGVCATGNHPFASLRRLQRPGVRLTHSGFGQPHAWPLKPPKTCEWKIGRAHV